jgi:hypothetical protein
VTDDDMNASLEVDILKEELLSTLQYLKKGKILGLDGFLVEFFMGFYNHIKEDMSKVV